MSFQEMLENDFTFGKDLRPEFSEQDLMNINKEEERVYLQQNSTRISEYPPYRPWTKEEHSRFLDALQLYNSNDHAKIAEHVITRNLQDVKLHSYVFSFPKKNNSFLQNSNDALMGLFGSSSGLGMLGGGGGLNMSGIGLNGSIGGMNSLSGSIGGGRMGGALNGSLSNMPLMGSIGGMGNLGGLGNSMTGIGGGMGGMAGVNNMNNMNNMVGGMGNMNNMMGNGGLMGMNNMGGVMGGGGGVMGNSMNQQTVNLMGMATMGMAGNMYSNPQNQPAFPKFSSMMEEWSDEEQLAFEEALKKFPIDSANPLLAFSKIASCIPGGKRAAHDVQLRYEMLLLKLGIKLESDQRPPLLHQNQGLPPNMQASQLNPVNIGSTQPTNAQSTLHGSQGLHNSQGLQNPALTQSQNSPAQVKTGKASPSPAPAPVAKAAPGKVPNNPAINTSAGIPNVTHTSAAAAPAPAKGSRKRSSSTTEGQAAAAAAASVSAPAKGSRAKRRAKDTPEEPAPAAQPAAPAAATATTAAASQPPSLSTPPTSTPSSSTASSSTSPPAGATAGGLGTNNIEAEYEKANKMLDENLELINQIAPMDTSPARVARNLELMMKIRDTIGHIVNWTSTTPSSAGVMHQMPPLPVRINETLINYLSKTLPSPASTNPPSASNASSASSASSASGGARGSNAPPPLTFNSQFNSTSPMFSPPMLSLPSSGYTSQPPPPLFSPSILNLTPSSGFLSPGGLLGLASPTSNQFMLGSPTLGSNK